MVSTFSSTLYKTCIQHIQNSWWLFQQPLSRLQPWLYLSRNVAPVITFFSSFDLVHGSSLITNATASESWCLLVHLTGLHANAFSPSYMSAPYPGRMRHYFCRAKSLTQAGTKLLSPPYSGGTLGSAANCSQYQLFQNIWAWVQCFLPRRVNIRHNIDHRRFFLGLALEHVH